MGTLAGRAGQPAACHAQGVLGFELSTPGWLGARRPFQVSTGQAYFSYRSRFSRELDAHAMKESIAGSLTGFNIYFADGQCLLLTRDAMGLVEMIRSFGESKLAEFSISPVDENSIEEMCRRSNA